MYIFSATDDEFLDNLRFFIREAVHGDQLCDYVIVVQGTEGSGAHQVHLPDLPPHARYVFRRNQCYDWGTFGWLLRSRTVDARRYKYFFFINCSVRGPYLPTYARGVVHWTQPFIHRLRGDVKLVGPTISCEGSPLDGDPKSTKWRRNPHVQSYAIATDRQGLQVLLKDRQVFRCHRSRWSTIYHSELGSSAAILAAGFNIDCFMTRYQGVDWRDPAFAECNGEMSPQGEHMSDGLTLDPFEVMFVKVKSFTLMNGVSSAVKAVRYHQWMHPPEGQEGEEAEEPGESAAGAESGSARSGAEQGERVLSVKGNGEGRATECVPLKAGVNGSQALEDGTEGREGTGAETGGSGVGSNGQCVGGSESSGAFEGRGARWRRRWRHDITTNEYLSDVPRFKVPRVLEAKARGAACFDFDFYVTNNPDLRRARVSSTSALWKHYVYFGQFEPRRYNFTCPFDYDRFAIDAEPGVSQPGK